MSPFISIIVPCYNQEEYLPETLESVLNQSYVNWECLIINDGSPDNSETIALEYCKKDTRFKYHKKVNGGLSSARNEGIKLAKGDFIQLLDSDDLLEKDKLKTAVDLYQSSKSLDDQIIIYSGMRYFEDSEPKLLKILGRNDFVGHINLYQYDTTVSQLELLKVRNLCVISAPLYPKKTFKNNWFDERLTALEDWDFHLRCVMNNYKFHYAHYKDGNTLIRLHDQSMMRDQKLLDENFQRFNVKHGLRTAVTNKKNVLKEFLKTIVPPIFIKVYQGLLSVNK